MEQAELLSSRVASWVCRGSGRLTSRCSRRTHQRSRSNPDFRQVRSQLNARTLGGCPSASEAIDCEMPLRFAWDARKAAANVRKHGISFPEAASAFADLHSITIPDPDHSAEEDRFVLIGRTRRQLLVVVAHVERGTITRIISARSAGRRERRMYEEGE
jgi:uncharacterized DUF497 family protein